MKHLMFTSLLLLTSLFYEQTTTAQSKKSFSNGQYAVKIASAIEEDEVTVEWITDREVNIRFFILERSLDGVTYSMIAMIPAKNRFALTTRYKVNDQETLLQPGMQVHYQLKTVDMNGLHQVSTLVVGKDAEGLISSR